MAAWTTPQNYTTGQVVDESDMDAISDNFTALLPVDQVAWTTWTPSYSNITVGNGTVTTRYTQIGNLVVAQYLLVFGNSTSIDGSNPTVSLPVTATSILSSNNFRQGDATFFDSGTANRRGEVVLASTTTMNPRVLNASTTYLHSAAISATVPFTWTTNDELGMQIVYEAA